MSGKVLSLFEARRKREQQSGAEWVLDEKSIGVVSRGEFHGGVLGDGSLVIEMPGGSQHSISLVQASNLQALLSNLIYGGMRVHRKARGADRWIPRPGNAPYTYWMKHDGTERLFRRTTTRRVRYPTRCESCRATIASGSTAYCEAKPEPWAVPNWRTVKLCVGCVERPVRSGIEEVKNG